jgi:hypothetical protein
MINEKTIALRLLIRRGVTPADIRNSERRTIDEIFRRTARGNISMQNGDVFTQEDLDRERDERRAKLLEKQKASGHSS